jgi:5-methyltetrahydrofolate--homocysteine methyltransferase
MPSFREALHSGRILLMDGAMGTELLRAGMGPRECFEAWNLTHPERISAVHRAYADAGAQCLLTNSFQSNPTALAGHGLADKLEAINAAAVALARRAAGPERWVLGDVGPIQPLTPASLGRTLLSLRGVDAILLETWSADGVRAAEIALRPEWNPEGVPVLLSFTFRSSPPHAPCLEDGTSPEQVAAAVGQGGVAAVGVNCGKDIGLAENAEILRRYRTATPLPLFARPNAGSPAPPSRGARGLRSDWDYPLGPDQLAAGVVALLQAGATMVGGCCGTTPAHIAALCHVLATG